MNVENLVAREQRLADQGAICAYEQRIGLSRGDQLTASLIIDVVRLSKLNR